MAKNALITGITGQDGSYLAESLLESGFIVHGLVRQSSLMQRTRLDSEPLLAQAKNDGRLLLHYADLTDSSSLQWLVRSVAPDFVYHLAGQSHIQISFDMPEYTAETVALGAAAWHAATSRAAAPRRRAAAPRSAAARR